MKKRTKKLFSVGGGGVGAGSRQVLLAAALLPIDPANTLLIDTDKGRIVVAMRPEFAPLAVARIKLLARSHVYDGLLFHRVIDGFVDQTGNPNNRDGGASAYPNLPPEFRFEITPDQLDAVAARRSDGIVGFIGASPVFAEPSRQHPGKLSAWGIYCAGVAGMGRQADIGTANSEIFFMRAASRRLDHDYTVWGRAVAGLDVIRAIAVGEPPARPDRMLRVRVLEDLPQQERPTLRVLDVRAAAIAALRAEKGADFSPCDVPFGP